MATRIEATSENFLDQRAKDEIYASIHTARYLKRYPGQWVAIHNQRLVARGNTFNAVADKLEESHIPLALTYLRYIR